MNTPETSDRLEAFRAYRQRMNNRILEEKRPPWHPAVLQPRRGRVPRWRAGPTDEGVPGPGSLHSAPLQRLQRLYRLPLDAVRAAGIRRRGTGRRHECGARRRWLHRHPAPTPRDTTRLRRLICSVRTKKVQSRTAEGRFGLPFAPEKTSISLLAEHYKVSSVLYGLRPFCMYRQRAITLPTRAQSHV